MKKKRKYNPNLVKSRRSYTLKEIAEIFSLHIRTVQDWVKQGLKVIDESQSPYLVLGQEVRDFLKAKRQKRKRSLKPGEFYCTKCNKPRKSIPGKIIFKKTDKLLGKNGRQVIIKGICVVCKNKLFLFSSQRKVMEMKKKRLNFVEKYKILIGSAYSSLKTDNAEAIENDKFECDNWVQGDLFV